jgi:hypothetical protein
MSERPFDDRWVVAQLNIIAEKLSPIPAMEDHLRRQNNSIEKHTLSLEALDIRMSKLENAFTRQVGQLEIALDKRISVLERTAATATASWGLFVDSVLKVIVGVATGVGITLLLLRLFGIS